MTQGLSWIAVDWGTTHVRAWAIAADGSIIAERQSADGMGKLSRDAFEPALLSLIGTWLDGPTVVVACGMVGSRQGWVEAPYESVPCAPQQGGFATPAVTDARLQVHVIPGLRQEDPADVMRGEETQIAGLLSLNPGWDGIVCLPGTHTKWVQVSAGEVVSFQTAMTGDLFAAISGSTVLRHSVGDGWNDDAFSRGLDESISRPERIAARLFSIRAEHLLAGEDAGASKARLSGLLIGAELAATRPYWLGQDVIVVGEGGLSRLYRSALSAQSVAVREADAEAATLAGLTAAYHRLRRH